MANWFINFLRNFISAIIRDIIGGLTLFKVENRIKTFEKKNIQYADIFRKTLSKYPNKPCIVFEEETWTFQDVSLIIIIIFIFILFGLTTNSTVSLLFPFQDRRLQQQNSQSVFKTFQPKERRLCCSVFGKQT